MSAEQWREEYGKKEIPLKHSLKNKFNHINELLHFIWTILRGEGYPLPPFSFLEALDVNYYGIGRPQMWFEEELFPESQLMLIYCCPWAASAEMLMIENVDKGLTSAAVSP